MDVDWIYENLIWADLKRRKLMVGSEDDDDGDDDGDGDQNGVGW